MFTKIDRSTNEKFLYFPSIWRSSEKFKKLVEQERRHSFDIEEHTF